MKIVTIVGARPQFIKASALSREILKHPEMQEIIIHTGQHFDANMSDVFFREMDIPAPRYQLDVHSLPHGAMTGRMMEGIERILMDEKPDWVLVYGDTNSTLAGALAAKKLHIRLAHVEAGLRSFNMKMPEEINRIVTDRISDLLLCPTETAMRNLKNEGFDTFESSIVNVGDIMYDAALYYGEKALLESSLLESLGLQSGGYVLATLHRQENTDHPGNMEGIIRALNDINGEVKVVMPVHPRTRQLIFNHSAKPAFTLIDPVGYIDMVALTSGSKYVVTDSGGLQKEAYFFRKYCITLREETEWTELVEAGANTLCGASYDRIMAAVDEMPQSPAIFDKPLYGDGKTAAMIVKSLIAMNELR